MSEPAAATPPAATRTTPQIGSFALGPRVIDTQQRLGKAALVAVTGLPGTDHAGVAAFAYCTPLGELTAEQTEQISAILMRIKALAAPTLVPALETGLAGKVAYVAEAAVSGERLSDTLARERRLPPWKVAQITGDVGVALDAAHRQRISHGQINPMVIWLDGVGSAKLGGFGLAGRGPNRDQELLAALGFELLSGQAWTAGDGAHVTGAALVDRVRGQVPGLTERVAAVLARGLEKDSAHRFPSVLEYANAFRDAVAAAAADVAAGAWEAISRSDSAMASLLTDMTATYDPYSAEISLLRVRLDKHAMSDATLPLSAFSETAVASDRQFVATDPNPALTVEPSANPSGAPYDEAELRRLFMPPAEQTKTPKGNPWVVFLSVIFGMIALLTVLAALAFNQS